MAGKHVGSIVNRSLGAPGSAFQLSQFRNVFPGTGPDCAFAEARMAKILNPAILIGANPYAAPDDRYHAWVNGFFTVANPPIAGNDNANTVLQTGTLAFPPYQKPSGNPV